MLLRRHQPPGSLFCIECGRKLARGSLLGQPDGDRRVVSVVFTDVSGFTAMSEKLDPEEVTGIINAFFAVLTEPIYHYGGTVDKYIGDAIMALFGAPIAHEDDAERAVAAAWDMQTASARYAADLEKRKKIRLRCRIGIHTGLVVAGAVGGDHKRDYTVLGDTVNLASRLEANARPGNSCAKPARREREFCVPAACRTRPRHPMPWSPACSWRLSCRKGTPPRKPWKSWPNPTISRRRIWRRRRLATSSAGR